MLHPIVTGKHYGYDIDKNGIYSTENVYHDDVIYNYHVDFNEDEEKIAEKFNRFLEAIYNEGKEARSKEIANLLGFRR